MIKHFICAVVLVSGMVAGGAQAGSIRCEGCTDLQAGEKAKQLGIGQHVVSSFSTNRIWLFDVFDRNRGEPGTPVVIGVSPQPVPAEVQAVFDDAQSFYVTTNGTMNAVVMVQAEDLGVPGLTGTTTAFDVSRNFNLRAQLGDRLATGSLPGAANLDRAGEQIGQGLFGLIGAGDASIEVTVQFNDGSTVVYKLSVNSGTGQYQLGRSRTANGQAIPDANAPGMAGR